METILDTSARVGSILVPAASLESYLGTYASLLTVWTHDDVYRVRVLGSAVGVMRSGVPILICSGHQIRDVELSDVGLLFPDGSNLVTSSGSRTFVEGEHTQLSDAYDVAAFDFSGAASAHPMLTRNFFKFDEVPPDTPNLKILAFIVAGYPSADQKYELEEKNHLGMVRRVMVAEPDSQPSDPALLKLKFFQELDFDPDGLSGGPVFVVQIVNGEPRAFLAGVTLRAGRTHCYILKSGFLWEFLSSFV